MRLNRYLARAGIASRRAADELIAAGRVRIDGRTVRELGTAVAEGARVEVDGRAIEQPLERSYLVLNKPVGVVTTLHDPQRRRTVADLLPPGTPRVVPVGRLDYDTSGLLLFTDDGDLAHRLTHPRYGVEKTYRALIRGNLSQEDVRALLEGVQTAEFRAAGARLRVVARRRDGSVVDLTIHEGRNRQVRRMFDALGHEVVALERIRFGPLALGALARGAVRPLGEREIAALRNASGVDRG